MRHLLSYQVAIYKDDTIFLKHVLLLKVQTIFLPMS